MSTLTLPVPSQQGRHENDRPLPPQSSRPQRIYVPYEPRSFRYNADSQLLDMPFNRGIVTALTASLPSLHSTALYSRHIPTLGSPPTDNASTLGRTLNTIGREDRRQHNTRPNNNQTHRRFSPSDMHGTRTYNYLTPTRREIQTHERYKSDIISFICPTVSDQRKIAIYRTPLNRSPVLQSLSAIAEEQPPIFVVAGLFGRLRLPDDVHKSKQKKKKKLRGVILL